MPTPRRSQRAGLPPAAGAPPRHRIARVREYETQWVDPPLPVEGEPPPLGLSNEAMRLWQSLPPELRISSTNLDVARAAANRLGEQQRQRDAERREREAARQLANENRDRLRAWYSQGPTTREITPEEQDEVNRVDGPSPDGPSPDDPRPDPLGINADRFTEAFAQTIAPRPTDQNPNWGWTNEWRAGEPPDAPLSDENYELRAQDPMPTTEITREAIQQISRSLRNGRPVPQVEASGYQRVDEAGRMRVESNYRATRDRLAETLEVVQASGRTFNIRYPFAGEERQTMFKVRGQDVACTLKTRRTDQQIEHHSCVTFQVASERGSHRFSLYEIMTSVGMDGVRSGRLRRLQVDSPQRTELDTHGIRIVNKRESISQRKVVEIHESKVNHSGQGRQEPAGFSESESGVASPG